MLGSGHVGRGLGVGFLERGDEVVMGTRNPDSARVHKWLSQVGRAARATDYAEAAEWCELAVYAPTWPGAKNVVRLARPENLAGKVVIDVTNPLGALADGTFGLVVGRTDSAGETLQRWLPESFVVKAFNSTGVELMVHPQLAGGPPSMPIAGNDEAAKALVTSILEEFGWDVLDLGSIVASRSIEGLTLAWIEYGEQRGEWDHSWRMLRGR